jgi:two-component system, OmpR family, sensor kinase
MSGVEFVPQPMAPQDAPAGPSSRPDDVLDPPPPASGRRLWLRSLQSRLVAGVVALVLVLVMAIGASTYFALHSFLFSRLDEQVSSLANTNANLVRRCLAFGIPRCSLSNGSDNLGAPQSEWVAVLNTDGTVAVPVDKDSRSLKQLQIGTDTARAIVADPAVFRDVGSGGAAVRVSGRRIETPSGDYVIVSGLSTGEVRRTLGRLISIEFVIGGSAILLAFVITTVGVRRSLRNLYAVTGTAREVAAELSPTGAGLDRRVPVVEEGTEVGQLAESMNTLLAAVETQFAARLENEQRMRQFLADASHELRTPLTSIRGYAELARMQRAATGDTESGADNLDRIESEGTRMSRLVDDLLLLARGDADDDALAMHRELVDVSDVLDDAVSGSRAAFPERPISLEVAPVPAVLGDHDQLQRVVRNLINNAAVHTEAGRPIHVRAFTDAGGAVITVADGGPGLPPELAARVFERFWRADKARTRARGGSGLGLSIVATIVRQHGGSVRFDSTVEGGSTVTVWLPAAG